MEDKSPFFSGGAEFKAPDSDVDDEKSPNSLKKKKNPISKLWAKLFDKETEQPKEEHKGFLEAFGAFFSKVTGVEKSEIDDIHEQSQDAEPKSTPDLRFPLLGGVDVPPATDVEPMENPDTSTEADTAYDQTYAGELPVPHDDVAAETQEPSPDDGADIQPDHYNIADIHLVEELVPQDTQREELIDQSSARNAHIEASGVQERGQPVIQERETVVERRGGAGAALLAVVVANQLSKSRDRKIQAEANQLQKKVERLQRDEQRDAYDIERLRSRSHKQAEQLRAKRETRSEKPQNTPELVYTAPSTTEKRPSPALEAKTTLEKADGSPSPQETKGNTVPKTETKHDETPQRRELDPVVLEQVEQAAEQNIALERYFERRHEVKDVPSNSLGGQTGLDLGTRTTQSHAQDFATQANQQLTRLEQQQRQSLHAQQSYQKAAKQGVMAGIILLVSFSLIVFICSLLN